MEHVRDVTEAAIYRIVVIWPFVLCILFYLINSLNVSNYRRLFLPIYKKIKILDNCYMKHSNSFRWHNILLKHIWICNITGSTSSCGVTERLTISNTCRVISVETLYGVYQRYSHPTLEHVIEQWVVPISIAACIHWMGHVRDVAEAAIYRIGVMGQDSLLHDISVNKYVWAFVNSQTYWSLYCNSRLLGRLAV